ncbi:hypothetical protein BGL34_05135 [Fructilactobacillus lindneri]|uniref:Competence protein ComFA n=1 Tax=Fructilactobacillus lindneri TaxID=53444 RepID=A0AB33BND2_9LACO|nr:helicase-related protein [Fructilactobacillus lindneri]ANZ58467.1 hypothetical protein AYR60_06850 [Fructilactobacillus lindneri]ANZ59777.1 hypothetical protein AYR59_07040 [Fructilactobacillus lindneri]POG98429.1 hypothetical protein BGL31_00325 [Fructilactobacillus lindneri]POH03828.1 hypothetical protein BGL32_00325 [Fructilactobacillus lindneri]POH04928.1 hypothetical protein BGL33_01570 [Fructilactobacillus lindneri]
MIDNEIEIAGRFVPADDLAERLLQHHKIDLVPAITIHKAYIHCTRCGSDCEKSAARISDTIYYCFECVNLGRLDSTMKLAAFPEINQFKEIDFPLTWKGKLTELQQQCSNQVVQAFKKQQDLLLWAVTGAGKTEISFAGIEWALQQQLRVAIASPRVDVCVELFPRYQEAFQDTSMILLHGKSTEKYQYRQLTICTTHQLLRFKQAFDILILDEVDAFPFANNPMLEMAAKRAVKVTGCRLLMTATPSKDLLQHYQTTYLPLRFHRHLLPQMKLHLCFNWNIKIYQGKLPAKFVRMVLQKIKMGQRFLIFVPRIKDLAVVDRVLSKKYQGKRCWETVYAGDEQRMEKVQMMRSEQVQFLITTTILERGVTFPGIDVMILGADERSFSVASLVQIAGRVGRKATRPFGNVDCFIGGYSKNVTLARQQIAEMNRRGRKIEG